MVTQAIVYRKLPDRPKRQYVSRIINGWMILWRTDRAAALAMPRDDAKALADTLWLRSRTRARPERGDKRVEPPGEYGFETLEVAS